MIGRSPVSMSIRSVADKGSIPSTHGRLSLQCNAPGRPQCMHPKRSSLPCIAAASPAYCLIDRNRPAHCVIHRSRIFHQLRHCQLSLPAPTMALAACHEQEAEGSTTSHKWPLPLRGTARRRRGREPIADAWSDQKTRFSRGGSFAPAAGGKARQPGSRGRRAPIRADRTTFAQDGPPDSMADHGHCNLRPLPPRWQLSLLRKTAGRDRMCQGCPRRSYVGDRGPRPRSGINRRFPRVPPLLILPGFLGPLAPEARDPPW
jgi:hypothetical protein